VSGLYKSRSNLVNGFYQSGFASSGWANAASDVGRVYIYMYIYTYIYVHTHTHIYTYIYIYIVISSLVWQSLLSQMNRKGATLPFVPLTFVDEVLLVWKLFTSVHLVVV
jgi:hypothetical protein